MYEDLENDESDDEGQTGGIYKHEKTFFRNKIDGDFFGARSEPLPTNARSLALDELKTSDTRVYDGSSVSNPLAYTETISGTGSFAGSRNGSVAGSVAGMSIGASQHVQQYQATRQPFTQRKKQRTDANAFLPIQPKKVNHTPAGYMFQKHAADAPLSSWSTIDIEQQTVKTTSRTNENYQPPSDKSHDPRNTPLAAVFGHTRGELAPGDRTNLTTENLQELERDEPTIDRGIPTLPSGIAISNDGSRPLYPVSRPDSNTRLNHSQNSSLFQEESVATDPMSFTPSSDIHPTIRHNFVSADEVLTHQASLTEFDRANSSWSNSGPLQGFTREKVVVVNNLGNGNTVRTEFKVEIRILDWDQNGNYKGEHKGSVKKRVRLWVVEQYKLWDAEMKAASSAYRELMAMRPDERMAAIQAARMPITHWGGSSGAAGRDVFEEDFPAIYKKRWDAQKARRERLESILKAIETAKSQRAASSRSGGSQQTTTTVSVVGVLGDLDGPVSSHRVQHNRDGTFVSSRNSVGHVYALAERAIRAKSSRQSKTPGSNQRQGAGRDPRDNNTVRSGSSSSTITPGCGGGIDVRSVSGRTGYSIAGPRSVASQGKYPSLGSQRSYAQDRYTRSKQGSNFGTRASSSATNHGRNDTDSVRTDIGGIELLEFDDSPLLQDLSDVSFPYDGFSAEHVEQHKLAERQSSTRGRAVVVRLHATVEFTGDAIAKRVFGGIVQEFQLHPEQKSAIVVFVHPVEARAFVSHVRSVREQGTEQEIRELQIEAAWYKGQERESIRPYQKKIMSYHIASGATRALKLHNISSTRSYKEVADDLNNRLGKLFLWMKFESPLGHLTLAARGRSAIVEFASLGDAIEAYLSLKHGLEAGYENCNPEFMPERSSKPAFDKPYCRCLGCDERKKKYESKREAKIQELREHRDNYKSSRGSAARTGSASITPPASSVVANSARGPGSQRLASVVPGGTTDTESDLIQFSEQESAGVESEDEEWYL